MGMRSYDELEALWQAQRPAAARAGRVHLICARKGGEHHETPARATLDRERGLVGDRWWDKPERDVAKQITLMTVRVAELVAGRAQPLHMVGDNFLVDLELDEASLPAGTRLRLGGAVLEISEAPHTGCKTFMARFGLDALRWVNDHRERRLRGVNCRVVLGGDVAEGDPIEIG